MYIVYPLRINSNHDGIVELVFDFFRGILDYDWGHIGLLEWYDHEIEMYENHRIYVDLNTDEINTLIYYIGDKVHNLVMYDAETNPSRYTAESVSDGIRLAWQVDRYPFYREPGDDGGQAGTIRIYRSAVEGEKGVLIGENPVDMHFYLYKEHSLFEFVDTTAEAGSIYYYSLWAADNVRTYADFRYTSEIIERDKPIIIGGSWQMVVDVNAVMGLE
jgi:hypothetical protein